MPGPRAPAFVLTPHSRASQPLVRRWMTDSAQFFTAGVGTSWAAYHARVRRDHHMAECALLTFMETTCYNSTFFYRIGGLRAVMVQSDTARLKERRAFARSIANVPQTDLVCTFVIGPRPAASQPPFHNSHNNVQPGVDHARCSL
jgi:hypothetical protein